MHPFQRRVCGSVRQAPPLPSLLGWKHSRPAWTWAQKAQAASLRTAPWLVWSLPVVPTLPLLGASQESWLFAPPPAPLLQEGSSGPHLGLRVTDPVGFAVISSLSVV